MSIMRPMWILYVTCEYVNSRTCFAFGVAAASYVTSSLVKARSLYVAFM